jgi:hypothetical protein
MLKARITGALWLTCIVTGVFAFVAGWSLIVRGDAAATAANILANEALFRRAFAADVLSGASYLGVTGLLYFLLKPVDRSVSLLAAFFGLAGVGIGAVGYVSRLAALVLLNSDRSLSAFPASQLQAMALFALELQRLTFSISIVFFGIQCILAGFLIARSTFLPRPLGVLLATGGATTSSSPS